MVEVPKEASNEIHKETRNNDMVQLQIMLESWGKSIALKFQELNLQGFNQDMGTGAAIVVFGLITCVACFVFGSHIRRNGNAPKQSSPADEKHSTKPVVKEKSPSLPLAAERDEPKKLVISNTMPLITTSAVPVGSRAPSVEELLAEFEVGEISRSVKSAGSTTNSRMKDDEVSSSRYSYFSEQGFSQLSAGNSVKSAGSTTNSRMKDDEVSSSRYSYFSEQGFWQLSAGNYNSSERSIAKKKQLRKELGSNDLAGEGRNNEVMTPLRRSTRMQSSEVEGCGI